MEKIKPGMLYIAVDGDGIGKLVGRAVIANDVEELHKVSGRIDAAQAYIDHWCKQNDGAKISGGGDEATMAIPPESRKKIKELRSGVEKSFGYTISAGVGKNLSEAGTALLVAKLRGKNRIVYFNKYIKEDIKKAKRRVREKRATQEEYKLAEAYLEKSELMGLCNLHKADAQLVDKKTATKKPRGPKLGDSKPKLTHEGMMGLDSPTHSRLARQHEKIAWNEGRGTPHQEGHQAMHDMHRAYSTATTPIETGHESSDDWARDKEINANPEKRQAWRQGNQKRHEDHAKGLHEKASAISATARHLDNHMLDHKKSEKYCNLHKSKLCDIHKNDEDAEEHNHDNEDDRTDDCAFCQDLDAQENADGTAGMHDDCPACQEYNQSNQETGHIDDCPYCQTENITGSQANPQHEDTCDCPWCAEYDQDQSNVEAQDMGAEHPENCPQCQEMYGDAVESDPAQNGQQDPNLQGHETAEEVLNLLDQEPGQGNADPTQEAGQIDNTEMPQGDAMKDNVSVKSNFGDAQKQNISDQDQDFQQDTQAVSDPNSPMPGEEQVMGDSQGGDEQPDMMGVLQGGLQDNQDQIQREKVVNMVSQTLQQFKANKQSLEATREQNEGLYTSCIQMLKSMIELCKLLGLEPSPTSPNSAPAPTAPAQQQSPPKPAPMQQKAAPMEGAAPDPKNQG